MSRFEFSPFVKSYPGIISNRVFFILKDINECGRTDKFVVYKSAFKEELYAWKQCSAVGARCINEHASYRCECLTGFVGDGYECHDVDECQLNAVHDYQLGCVENSRCINLPGSYRCECREGFEAKNGTCVGKLQNL